MTTGVVGEFPELQGVMGRYYALNDGEDKDVADAIRDHYRPLGPSDQVPTNPISICVALADKLDQLAGFFLQLVRSQRDQATPMRCDAPHSVRCGLS